jgi:isopenicillin-N epimerase
VKSTLKEISSLFHRDDSFTFLNAGTLSRTPKAVLQFMAERRAEAERNPTHSVFDSPRLLWEVQEKVAPLLGAHPQDFFFRVNITTALNDFFFALELPAGGEILATGMEYGATVNIAKVYASQNNLTFRQAPLPLSPEVTKDELVEAVTGAFGEATKVLLVSHILTGNGAIMPLAEIAAVAEKKGILVVVDGAHAPGAIALGIDSLGVDFYGGNFHKWFLGPAGTAFGWVNPRAQGRLKWKFGGWASFEVPASYRGFGGGAEAARRFFPGTIDTTPFEGLGKVVDFWAENGAENLRARQRTLRDRAAEIAEGLGWERVSPRRGELHGPLVSFKQPAGWPKGDSIALAERIYRECAVQLAYPTFQGEPLVRISPGVYSTEADVEEGLRRLAHWR